MKVAVVHEWLVSHAGSEKVVEQILALYPEADLFSLVDFLPDELREFIQHKPVTTTFIQNLPWAEGRFRQYLPLMPLAVEQFDLADYDLVISSNHAVAKGVLTRPDQLHISYVHTPIRYAWDLQQQYLRQSNLNRGLKGAIAQAILHYLRLWDVASANRVDCYAANSHYVARRIWKTYRRRAEVIYPPVTVERFNPHVQRQDFYLTVSRFVPYKRVDLTVEAFNQLGLPLVVIGEGPGWPQIKALAGANVKLLGAQSDAVVGDYMQRCKAFIFPAEEDFGITPVEAQAAGAPVVAYGKGGATETILPGETGLFFSQQSVESLAEAVQKVESGGYPFNPSRIRQNAERFSIGHFHQSFKAFVDKSWITFVKE